MVKEVVRVNSVIFGGRVSSNSELLAVYMDLVWENGFMFRYGVKKKKAS